VLERCHAVCEISQGNASYLWITGDDVANRSLLTHIRTQLWRPLPTELHNNIRLLYVEILWAAILAGVTSFNAAFAVRLGASSALIGWLNSAPALIAAVLSIPAARFLEWRADRRPYILWSLLVTRLGYLVVALLPTLAPQNTATWLVTWLILLNVPNTVFVAGWNPLLAEILPERRRAWVLSRRNIISAGTLAAVTFLAGRWLKATAFPTNYQAIYAFGVAAALVSNAFLERLTIPSTAVAEQQAPRGRISWRAVRERVLRNRSFLSMTFNSLVFNFGMGMSAPLFILYFVRELNADDGWIGLNSAVGSLATMCGFYVGERLVRRKGFHWVMVHLMPLSPLYPFLVALFPNLTLILLAGVLIGLINSGMTLGHFNVLLKLCPGERRASYLGFYSTIMNGAAFLAPLLSVALADRIGLRATLFLAAGVRLTGGLLFHVLKVEEPPEEAMASGEIVTAEDEAVSLVEGDDTPPPAADDETGKSKPTP
jgi:MFS family permease